jgi:signal transduction histidine kinase
MGYSYGAVDYITKPFDPDVLKAKVSVLVALHLQAERIARQRELLAEKRHELHRRQTERDEAERANRLKDEFLAFVSHELRTPLNAIVGWTELLSRGQLDPVSTRRAIETIRRNAELQTILVEDLIALSQMVLGSLRLNVQPVDLRSVVATSIATLGPIAEAKGVRLEYEPPGDDAGCIADPKRLHQVLCNLLSNAVKFTAPGGHVVVRLGDDDEDGWLRVEVADDGVGIRREALPHVFERFWQDRTLAGSESGLGLGLAVVRQLVDLHGGRVRAESDGEGQGTRITVRLRRNVEPASMTA